MTNYKRGDAVIRKLDSQAMTVVTKDGHKTWCAVESDTGLSYGAYDEDEIDIQANSEGSSLSRPLGCR